MEKWVQLLAVTVALLRLFLELTETLIKKKKKDRKKGRK